MQIINGKKIATELQEKIKHKLTNLAILPKLVVILVGENPASQVYVRNKAKKAEAIGIASSTIFLPQDISEEELVATIKKLNNDSSINGILIQLPLPPHINSFVITDVVDPKKDVDCFHSLNVGKLSMGENSFVPCTPYGCLYLLKHTLGGDLSGLDALVVGRSNIVGKPMFNLLLQENCTVTVAHSRSVGLESKCMNADIIVAAAGKPKLIKAARKSATIIDVGINSIDGKLIGDVDFDLLANKVRAMTPVPGGVGPMTITFLLINTVIAACQQNNIPMKVEQLIY